jgi:hypothetical protein
VVSFADPFNDDRLVPLTGSSVTLSVSPPTVTEDGSSNLIYTFTRTGVTSNELTVNYTVGGTATNGTDYSNIGTSVTFAANSATATVTVDPTADTTVESDETVSLTLDSGTGYTIGTTSAVTGTITNQVTGVPNLKIIDSSGDSNDAVIEFKTPLSKFRTATDSVFIRPSYPDANQYIDLSNSGSGVLTLSGIQVNASDVSINYNFATQGNLLLNPGQTQRIEIKYAPTTAKQNFNLANGLVITSNANNLPTAQVSLAGKSTFNADISYDGKVGFGDLGPLTANWNRSSTGTPWDPTADINGDGKVGFGDLGQLTAQWNQSTLL